MILGIGTDIVRIERIQRALERRRDAFAQRILTEIERVCFQESGHSPAYLAKRFAAKEAAAKALGTGIGKVSFQHLEVSNNDKGAPVLSFTGYAQTLQLDKGITSIHLSISDETDVAIAFVVLEN